MTQCSTFSKHPSMNCAGYPKEIYSGYGAKVIDSGGHSYIDWTWSGTGILGHAPQEVARAVSDTMFKGCAFGLPHVLERQTAELMRELLPDYAESVRFALNGTDAVAGAVRLARAVTGKAHTVIFEDSYHGASGTDWFIGGEPPSRGVGEFLYASSRDIPFKFEWNKEPIRIIEDGYEDVAAVIFEVREPPTPEFVEALNSLPDDVLLIADEVVTGFRLAKGGACSLYGLKPDLACFGKALGSGVPISALVGKEKYMREFQLIEERELEALNEQRKEEEGDDYEGPVFMSYTHGGNALGLAAAKATLEVIRDTDALEQIWDTGEKLQRAFLESGYARSVPVKVNNQPARHSFIFEDVNGVEGRALFTLFQQEMLTQGVLIGPTNCPTIAHTGIPLNETVEAIGEAMEEVLDAVLRGSVKGILEGPVPRPLYSRRTG